MYEKQNFSDGSVLTAEQLNHMETGIAEAHDALPKKLTKPETAKVGDYLRVKAVNEDGTMELEAAELPVGEDSGENVTQKEVITTVTVGSDAVVLDVTAPEQDVALVWKVDPGRTIPAFDNFLIPNPSYPVPGTFTTQYYRLFISPNIYGDADAFVSGHKYFMAIHYAMDGDATATLTGWQNYISPSGNANISGSGWIYGLNSIESITKTNFAFVNTNTGGGTINSIYAIDITAMEEAGTIQPDMTVADLAALFGGLELAPGQDYSGGSIGTGTATLSIARGGEITTVDNSSATATVKGGDILSVEGGSVTFACKVLTTVSSDEASAWAGIKIVFMGDSLTDPAVAPEIKYPDLIAQRTGCTAINMGVGGTGYWRGSADGDAFYQRMDTVPSDADAIIVFGSVNDWRIQNDGVEVGTAADNLEAGTLAGYVNECIDVAIARAPYAQIILCNQPDYHGIPDDIMESIANIIVDVARHRKIKCVDMYHTSGLRVDDLTFAAAFTTDYAEGGEKWGHWNTLGHEKFLAPMVMEALKQAILTV